MKMGKIDNQSEDCNMSAVNASCRTKANAEKGSSYFKKHDTNSVKFINNNTRRDNGRSK